MSFIDKNDLKDIAALGHQAYSVVAPYVRRALAVKGVCGSVKGVRDGSLGARKEAQIASRSLAEQQSTLCVLSASQAGKQVCGTLLSGVSLFFGATGLLGFRSFTKPQLFYLSKFKQIFQYSRNVYRVATGRQLLAGLESQKGVSEKLLWWKGELGIGESEVKEERAALIASAAVVEKVKQLLEDLPAVEAGDLAAEQRVTEGLAEVDALVNRELFLSKTDLGLAANTLIKWGLAASFSKVKLAITLLSIAGTLVGTGRSIYTSRLVDSISKRLKKALP